MVRRPISAEIHVVPAVFDERVLLPDSKLFPLVQLVVCIDVVFHHHPLERVFTILPYRGVKDTAVTIITGRFQMLPPAVF